MCIQKQEVLPSSVIVLKGHYCKCWTLATLTLSAFLAFCLHSPVLSNNCRMLFVWFPVTVKSWDSVLVVVSFCSQIRWFNFVQILKEIDNSRENLFYLLVLDLLLAVFEKYFLVFWIAGSELFFLNTTFKKRKSGFMLEMTHFQSFLFTVPIHQ